MSRLIRSVLFIVLAVTLAACAMRARSIADIRDDPGRYDQREVEVRGRVTTAWGLPLVPYGLYKIDDGTAEITVLSENRGTPARGAIVRVRGHVRQVASFGTETVGLHIQERSRHIERR